MMAMSHMITTIITHSGLPHWNRPSGKEFYLVLVPKMSVGIIIYHDN